MKHKEAEEEFLWFPEFGLRVNPFRFSDYRAEEDYHTQFTYISTKATKMIVSCAEAKTSAFIIGDRGCGKSVALAQAYYERGGFEMLGPNSMAEIYDMLCLEIVYERWNEDCTDELLGLRYRDYFEWMMRKEWCRYPYCRRKPRCRFYFSINKFKLCEDRKEKSLMIIRKISQVSGRCGLKREFVHRFVGKVRKDWLFLLDVPDDLVSTGATYFRNLLEWLLRCGTVIIMATREQYKKCNGQDVLARLPCYEFPKLKKKTLKEICEGRLKVTQKEGSRSPFSDGVIQYLADEGKNNPRTFIQSCSSVLVEMQGRGLKEPATVEFVEKCLLPLRARVTVNEALRELIESYIQEKKGWVFVSQIKKDLKERSSLEINSKSLGRKLKRLWDEDKILDHAYRPYSAYRFT